MAKALNLLIIAEGVETRSRRTICARAVDYGQGWLFAKAMPADEFIRFHRQNKRLRTAARVAE